MVLMIDFVSSVSSYQDLIRIPPKAPGKVGLPHMEGLEDIPFRWEGYMSSDINRKIFEMQSLKKYGPKNHLKSDFPEMQPVNADGSEVTDSDRDKAISQWMIVPEKNDVVEPPSGPYTHFQFHKDEGYIDPYAVPPLEHREANPLSPRRAINRRYKHAIRGSPGDYESDVGSEWDDDASGISQISGLSVNSDRVGSVVSKLSMGSDYKPSEEPPLDKEKLLKILVLPESELHYPHEMEYLHQMRRNTKVFEILRKNFTRFAEWMLLDAFHTWVVNMEHLREIQRHYMARRVQTLARTWLHRHTLQKKVRVCCASISQLILFKSRVY